MHNASTDPAVVRRWWRRWPNANVGIRTGAASGLVVVDIDPDHGGLESIRRLNTEHRLPGGLRVQTGSGGWHLYFTHPGGTIRNSASTALGPGIDVRGDGGYVIAPPSRHPTGSLYQWRGQLVLPQLPANLLERLQPPQRAAPAVSDPVRLDRALSAWAAKALDDEARQVRTAAAGGRNHRLNRAAFNLGQIAASGLLDPDTITEQLHTAALSAGLGAREATATIRSGLRAGMRHPRTPAHTIAPDHTPAPEQPGADVDLGSG